jgi:hypothetical protein
MIADIVMALMAAGGIGLVTAFGAYLVCGAR